MNKIFQQVFSNTLFKAQGYNQTLPNTVMHRSGTTLFNQTMEIKAQEFYQKIPVNRACRNHNLDFRCTLTVMIPEMVPQPICCKKIIWNK